MSDKKDTSPKFRIKSRRALIWLAIVLANLFVAQGWLLYSVNESSFDDPPWFSVILIGLASVALLAGLASRWRTAEDDTAGFEISLSWLARLAPYRRWLALLGAGLLTWFVLWRIPQLAEHESYTAVFLAWLLAIILFCAAVIPRAERGWRWPDWIRRPDGWFLGMVGLLALALFVRLWQIGSLPFTLSGDEASQGLEAVKIINGELRNPFTTGWLGVPTMGFFLNSYSLQLFGRNTMALRLPWAFVGAATVLVAFLLVRQMQGRRLAWITAVLLATYHYHIHYSRLGSNQIADPLFLALALLFLMRALDGKKRLDWTLLGVVTGLAFYFYAGARLTPVVVTAVLGYWFLLNPRRFWQEHGRGVVIAVLAFLLVAAPMIQYALRFPDDFNARLNQVGILQSGWLAREVEIRGESSISILFDQFQRAVFAFNYYPDRTVWYGLRDPLLDPFFGGLFLLGLVYGTLRLFTPEIGRRLAPMIAWWWGGILLGGMMTESPPSSQRLVTVAVPTCFLLAFILIELLRLTRQSLPRLPEKALLAVAVTAFAFVSLKTYFVDYTPQRIYGGSHAELATQIAPTLNRLKYNHRLVFVGAPWMYWGFATLPYLVPDAEASDIIEPLTAPVPIDWGPGDKGVVFIVLPQRQAELDELIVPTFPAGTRQEVYSPVDGRLMVTLYQLPPLR